MAFIREYMEESGDPFKFRRLLPPKKFRKAIKSVAKGALSVGSSFIPGMGIAGKLAGLLHDRGFDFDEDTIRAFARSYGLEAGDPRAMMGAHPPKAAKKRKAAGSGPKAKAAKKKAKRQGADLGTILAKNAGAAAKGAAGLGKALANRDVGAAMKSVFGTDLSKGAAFSGGRGFGGGHRRTNPANVKALRRAIRRVEGFQRVVKSVHKAFPALKPHQYHVARAHHGRKK